MSEVPGAGSPGLAPVTPGSGPAEPSPDLAPPGSGPGTTGSGPVTPSPTPAPTGSGPAAPGSGPPAAGSGLPAPGVSYRDAGVDIAAGEAAVDRIRHLATSTARPEVLGGIGGFGGCFALPPGRYRQPVLVAGTDGVGTKMQVARAAGRFGTIGIDLVAMCVDDLVCVGAEPLFLLDYLAVGRLDPDQVEQVVEGIADGCRQAGCALLGGEMAEHPGVLADGDVDVAGFAVGVVEADERLGPERVQAGDVLVGLASPGLRSNGYSLARRVLLGPDDRPAGEVAAALAAPAWEGAPRSLADELLLPSVIYAPAVLAVLRQLGPGPLRVAAHVTGGGIAGNLARVIGPAADGVVDVGTWTVPRIFEEIRRRGPVDDAELAAVFNLGLGMVLVLAPDAVDSAVGVLAGAGHDAVVVGRVEPGRGQVHLRGRWPWSA